MLQQPNQQSSTSTADNHSSHPPEVSHSPPVPGNKADNSTGTYSFVAKVEDGVERFYCTYPGCGKLYKRRCRAQEHIDLQHNPEGVVRFGCSQLGCSKSYCRLDGLKSHQKQEQHQGIKRVLAHNQDSQPRSRDVFIITPTPFDVSGSESTATAESVCASPTLAPLKTSTNEVVKMTTPTCVRYKCNVTGCGKSYATRFRCDIHMESKHTEGYEKPFKCSYSDCIKSYSTKDSLTRHKRGNNHFTDDEPDKRMEGEEPMKQPRPEDMSKERRDKVQELVALFDEL